MPAWDQTPEGADVSDAWDYQLQTLQWTLPEAVTTLNNLAVQPIGG